MAGAFTLQGFESPEETQARIGKAEMAAMRPSGNLADRFFQSGAQRAGALGGAIATSMGYEDPAVKQSRAMQEAMQGMDMSSSKSLYETAGKLQKMGLTKQAFAVTSKGNEVRKIEAAEAPDPAKLTRFKGAIVNEDGSQTPVIAYSDDGGNVYTRDGKDFKKNPPNLIGRDVGTTESDTKKYTTKTAGNIEAKYIDSTEGLARLDAMELSYNEESLTVAGQLGNLWTKAKDKTQLGTITKDERVSLEKDAIFRANATGVMASYIKQMSGVAAAEAEVKRLLKKMPNDKDSPIQFRAKMKALRSEVKANLIRYEGWMRDGLISKGMSKDQLKVQVQQATNGSAPAAAYAEVRHFEMLLKQGKINNLGRDLDILESTFKKSGWKLDIFNRLKNSSGAK